MKVYITRRGRPDFVVDAPTIADAIIAYWLATGETPKPSYRVHFGRRRKSRIVSSAIAYWALESDMRSVLSQVIRETATQSQIDQFNETVIITAELLGY